MGIKISALPPVAASTLADVVPANQSGVTSQETLQQVLNLFQANIAVKNPALAATTGALTATYSNGASGVGATLTNSGALAALVIDGVTLAVGDRVLVKNQVSTFQNGIYQVTATGSVVVAWVLQRTTDFDNNPNGEITQGAQIAISTGTANAGSVWIESAPGPFTVGTSPITFIANTGGGAAPSASATLVTTAGSVQTFVGPMANGQVVIGSTGATPVVANLAAGTGITIGNGAGTITINASGGGLATATIAGTTQAAAVNTQYVALNAAQTTVTLPAVYAVGDIVNLVGSTANVAGWILTAAAGDTIRALNATTSAGGTVTSSAQAGCCIEVVCDVANTSWVMRNFVSTILTTA